MSKLPEQVAPKSPAALPSATSTPTTLRNLFGIDPRLLALFRIAMGLLLLTDLLVRATDVKAIYADEVMFPRAVIHHHVSSIWSHQPRTTAPHPCEWQAGKPRVFNGIP